MLCQDKMYFRTLLMVVVLLVPHVKSCPVNQFQLPDGICCDFCEEGFYVTKNCSKSGNSFMGVSCLRCSVCADGTQIIASCRRFSDTQCTQIKPSFEAPPVEFVTTEELWTVHPAFYLIVPVVLITIIVAIVYKLRSRSSVLYNPAEEAFKTKV